MVVERYAVTDILRNTANGSFKWSHVAGINNADTQIPLCPECYLYFSADDKTLLNKNSSVVWPAFVWSVLKRHDVKNDAWKLLPQEWRGWWLKAFSELHGDDRSMLRVERSMFRDVTVDLLKDMKAIKELKWVGLMERELSLVLPEVKCPAGCSEFKHRSNDLPIDIVWEACLGIELQKTILMGVTKRAFTRMFRKDYLTPEHIGMNKEFVCMPAIAKVCDHGPPTVLCCRHHSTASKKQMIHPSVNPTGALASSRAGGLSPVVPVPRTIQKAKMSAFAASFQMSFLEGSYRGLDTMFLSTSRGVNSVNCPLAWHQDVLSYAFRHDITGYTKHKYESTWGLPGSIASKIDRDAVLYYPYMDELKAVFCKGATYVNLDDAVCLQSSIDFDPPEVGKAVGDDGSVSVVQFRGNYPLRLVWCHPATGGYGCRPPEVPPFKLLPGIDTRLVWLLSSMMLLVPGLWYAVTSLPVKEQGKWEGNLLTYLSARSLPHVQSNVTRSCPFPKAVSKKHLVENVMAGTLLNGKDFSMVLLRRLLQKRNDRFGTLEVHRNRFRDNVPHTAKIVIVTRDYMTAGAADLLWDPPESIDVGGGSWKLCYISATEPSRGQNGNHWSGVAFSRHLDSELPGWWKSDRSQEISTRTQYTDVRGRTNMWDTCVYVNKELHLKRDLRDMLLASCGGQHKVYCKEHLYPFITSSANDGRTCCCTTVLGKRKRKKQSEHKPSVCGRKAVFACTVNSCKFAICSKHHKAVETEDAKYYVGDICEYGDAPEETGVQNNMSHGFVIETVEDDTISLDDNTGVAGDGVLAVEEDYGEMFEAFFRTHENLDNIENDGEEVTNEPNENVGELMDRNDFVTCMRQGVDDIEDIDPRDMSDILATQEILEASIPTTNAGVDPIYTVTTGDYTECTVNNHVLLNNFGHMLIRRNRKLTGSLNQRHFLQRMVSRIPGDSLPLAYPEGMLFGHHFYSDTLCGSIVGAIPSAMLNSERVLGELGFASLEDHYRTRISNQGLMQSTDPKYHLFAFDCLSNLGLRGGDARVVLRRGFAEMQGEGGVRFKGNDEPLYDTDQVDSRSTVNKLSYAINTSQPAYFYTHTCGMKTHFGIKRIWDWLDSDELIQQVCEGNASATQQAEARKNVVDGMGCLLLRVWMEVMQLWIQYITKSEEAPMGKVTDYFFRMELQDAKANLPHLHAIVWTEDDITTEKGLADVLTRIRGFIGDIIRPHERERYKDEGVFKDDACIVRFLDMAKSFLSHQHARRCFIVAVDKNDPSKVEVTFRCKAQHNYRDNPTPSQHSLVRLPINHSDDAVSVLTELGLAETCPQSGKFVPLVPCLDAIKHYPPAHGNEGLISPCFGTLLARNPSMTNAQFATGYTLSRYVVKYLLTVDSYNTFTITPPKPTEDKADINANGEELPNQKITGNKIRQDAKEKKDKGNGSGRIVKQRKGRGFNVAEFYMLLFGYSPVITNIDFVHVQTRPFEERGAQGRRKPYDTIKGAYGQHFQHRALTILECVPSHFARKTRPFPEWRQFTPTQLELIHDDVHSPLAISSVTVFSGRCPELMFVTRLGDYRTWFRTRSSGKKFSEVMEWAQGSMEPHDVMVSLWIDGFSNQVRVRARAIPRVLQLLHARKWDWFEGYDDMLQLFTALQGAVDAGTRTEVQDVLLQNFVCDLEARKLPVAWFESVRPTRTNRFLIHVILSMGHIKDEYDLFSCASLRDTFIKAQLLDAANPELSAERLLREYVLEHLACLPAGTNTFDKYLLAASTTIRALFIHNTLVTDDVPTVLYCHAAEETADSIVEAQLRNKVNLLKYIRSKLEECGIEQLPDMDACMEATPNATIDWNPTDLPRHEEQPVQSFHEQREVMDATINLVQHYKSGRVEYTKGMCHVGAGGVGKTTILLLELLYCICQGLVCAITALLSERAQELAGSHIHDMFGFIGKDKLSAGQMAERACAALFRSPEKLELLRRIDVLGIDEAGAVSCEMLSAMCHVLRYVRKSNRPWGGVLLIATMDYLQLDPVSGRHALMSPMFTSCLFFRELHESVRAAFDAPWRRIQTITRMSATDLEDEAVKREFVELFSRTCSFTRDIDSQDVPAEILYVFGKNKPIKTQEARVTRRVRADCNSVHVTSTAFDEERTIDGNFRLASHETSMKLNSELKETHELLLYRGGRYQLTFNSQGSFSNSQMAVLFDIPDQSVVDLKTPITLVVAPAGCRKVPASGVSKQELLDEGWMEKRIGCPRRDSVINIPGGLRAKRRQYGIRYHIASTIHGVMGQTIRSLLTRVERGGKQHPYALWLPQLVVVLMSRTRYGKDTWFWLAQNQTSDDVANALYEQLLVTTRFKRHLSALLKALCSAHDNGRETIPYTLNHTQSIFRIKDIAFPTHRLGFVYLIVSTRDLSVVYIGSAQDLTARWTRHNQGIAAKQTAPYFLRPWAVLAYITGFNGEKSKYEMIEGKWIAAKLDMLSQRNPATRPSIQALMNRGKDVVVDYNRANTQENHLQFTSCGSIERYATGAHEHGRGNNHRFNYNVTCQEKQPVANT